MHDYNTWRIPTAEELALLRANGYLGDAVYMSSQTASSKGIVLLVTDDNETYSQKEAKSQEEEKAKARAREIALSGKGDNGVYKIGYYYDDGIKKGVVFKVSNGGKNGMIISATQAISMEVATAAADLTGGADAVVLRHPESVATIKKFITELI